MEDDDEFGDLYTDVLRPLMTPSFQSQAQQQHHHQSGLPSKESPKVTSASATSFLGRPIDLNVTSDDELGGGDELVGAPNSRPAPQNRTLASSSSSQPGVHFRPDARNFDLNEEFGQESGNSESFVGAESDSQARVLSAADGKARLQGNGAGTGGSDFMDTEPEIDIVIKERDEKDDDFVVKDENFSDKTKAIDNFSVGNGAVNGLGLDTEIPGLSIPGVSGVESRADPAADDDWDSDSDDDLQIVLNDNTHGPMGMERIAGGAMGDEDDDDDGDPLVIVADNHDPGHQPMIMEEQEWVGEDAGPGADGEKKEAGEAGKVNGVAVPSAPKVGYGPHGYHHPFHSQFKYVRPGASPIPGAPPAGPGVPGQVRPPIGMPPAAGRGRGDWRPPGMKGSPAVQKGFYQGYGVPVWGTGRGLDFTLPSHKTIFEVDIESFEEKPWRINGVDVSDFFNFGLTEESWKDYCKQLEQLRAGTTMPGKIRVYESGRAEQEYDPDLPPELAAAVVQDNLADGVKFGKSDPGLDDLARGTARVRPPLPTGRPIQVETGYGERLPSIDTRKPRISDLDVIIEIVCQGSLDDDTKRGDEMIDQAETDSVGEDVPDVNELEEPQEDAEHLSRSPHAYDSRKREVDGRRVPSVRNNEAEGDGTSAFNRGASPGYRSDSREQSPDYPERTSASSHEDRRTKGRAHSGSPRATIKERTTGNRSPGIKDSPVGSMDGRSSPLASSPGSVGISAEPKDSMNDGIVRTERGPDKDKGESALNGKMQNDSLSDETRDHPSKKQKLSSQSEPSLMHEVDDQEDSKAARSSENSKARSGSSNYRKLPDVEEEEVQGRQATRRGDVKRAIGGDEVSGRRKVRDDRQENERQRSAVRGREDMYHQKGWDSHLTHGSRVKSESGDFRRDVDDTEGAHQRRDEDIHGRRTRVEDTRKREYREKSGARQQGKARESERHEKDERLTFRKQLDNGNWRGNFDKDPAIRPRDRDDDMYNKRRKEEAHFFKELADKEESLHAHRESSSRRKRERDDVPDQRRRDDQGKTRDDDVLSARHKEREEWYRHKQMNQESQVKMDKEAARVGIRSGRAAEEKVRENQSRGKDEHRRSKELHPKDAVRPHELHSRRDRAENVNLSQQRGREDFYHGNPLNHDERRARIERAVTREDHVSNASDNYKVHENKNRDIPRKGKDSEAVDRKKHQDDTARIGDMVWPFLH
ncbi:OLC1v1035595C2 [Oldenlandia corymbosa var. corymbosa]|uniref:OLC1v1035595C2 n=1 Tax=Oldenlandia corymbosa var. corymbosa TaxID=529605 RepID=A0AAV1CTC3_OLDCO|nr:OLC1v1035595C2 [Oldenlandia corymbosa var. corymbosa]